MKKVIYEIGPDRIEVAGVGFMYRGQGIDLPDEKATDMLTNPMFKEVIEKPSKSKTNS